MAPILSRLTALGGGGNGGFGFGRRGKKRKKFLATGGTITTASGNDGKTYKIHTFTAPDTFTILSTEPDYVTYIEAVGGGGAGRGNCFGNGGGGGGSGLVGYFSLVKFSVEGNYPVTIGGGGGANPQPCGTSGSGGSTYIRDTSNSNLILVGGGGGTGGQGGGSGGSSITYPPSSNLVTSFSSPGGTGSPRPPEGNRPGGSPGIAWNNPNYNPTNFNIFFPSPLAPNTGRGGGGGAAGNPDAASGGPGQPGAIRIYYPVSYL